MVALNALQTTVLHVHVYRVSTKHEHVMLTLFVLEGGCKVCGSMQVCTWKADRAAGKHRCHITRDALG